MYREAVVRMCPVKKETLAQMLSCEFCEILKYTSFSQNTSPVVLYAYPQKTKYPCSVFLV